MTEVLSLVFVNNYMPIYHITFKILKFICVASPEIASCTNVKTLRNYTGWAKKTANQTHGQNSILATFQNFSTTKFSSKFAVK